jgi:peptidoglycan/LPS O-acetylase OafA/YrhL
VAADSSMRASPPSVESDSGLGSTPPGPMMDPSPQAALVLSDQNRLAPLDGIRAFAVVAVILYHAEPGWAIGGYFGVDVFFALSGYLITSLLLREWQGTRGIALRAFWGRRARRLLPGLFLMLAVVGVVAWLLPTVLGSPGLFGDTVATVGYVANWHQIAGHTDYFTMAANPSPLLPTWSLAIEEQFYLVWPLVLLALLGGFRRRKGRPPSAGDGPNRLVLIAGVAATLAAASALLMAILTPVGAASVNRSYYGSDTRTQGLLIGAALAALTLWWGPIRTSHGRRALWLAGFAGAAAIAVMWRTVTESSALTFHGGFALLALAAAAVIACVTLLPAHPLARVLSVQPLPYVGRISYGMYLWYWPVLLVMTPGRTHLDGVPLLAGRMVVIVAIAAASFHLIETPVRRGALAGWRSWVTVPAAVLTISLLPLGVPALAAQIPTALPATVHLYPALARLPSTVPAAPPVRILLVGDSMVGSLDAGLSTVASRYGAQIVNGSAPGCSVTEATQVRVLWYTLPPGVPCQADNPQHVLDVYRSLVRQFDPDVVVYLARSDTLDTERNGIWQHLGQPAFDQWAKARFEQAISALSVTGAHVVLLTTPYYQSGQQGNGQPLPENDPSRVAVDNRLLAAAAAHDPTTASVIPLGTMLSPSGGFSAQVDGVPVRCTDGIHLTVPGGQWVGERILPQLVLLGRSHAEAATQDHRPSLPPQSPPEWYAKLPCAT